MADIHEKAHTQAAGPASATEWGDVFLLRAKTSARWQEARAKRMTGSCIKVESSHLIDDCNSMHRPLGLRRSSSTVHHRASPRTSSKLESSLDGYEPFESVLCASSKLADVSAAPAVEGCAIEQQAPMRLRRSLGLHSVAFTMVEDEPETRGLS